MSTCRLQVMQLQASQIWERCKGIPAKSIPVYVEPEKLNVIVKLQLGLKIRQHYDPAGTAQYRPALLHDQHLHHCGCYCHDRFDGIGYVWAASRLKGVINWPGSVQCWLALAI